jgi:hypothetical protein
MSQTAPNPTPCEYKNVQLSSQQVETLVTQLRLFRHELNNKMTVVSNASAMGQQYPDMAAKMLEIISGSLGHDNKLLTNFSALFETITGTLQVKLN